MSTKPEKIIFYTDTEEVEFYVIEQTKINDVNYISYINNLWTEIGITDDLR